MTNTPNFEQVAAAQKANAEVVVALMRTSFEGLQRLAELNMAATRELFNNTVANANTLLAAKDVNDVSAINQQLAKPGVDKMMDYSRKVYDLVAQMQKDVTTVMETQYSQFQKEANSAISKTKSAPVGGDVFAAAMKTMLDQTNKAFEGMNAVARQMSELAESNLQTAVKAAPKAAGSATKAAAKK
jgi:phasin family protein